MSLNEALRRIQMLFQGNRFQQDLEEEMRLHRELREEEYIERGENPEVAHRTANQKFGNPTVLREKSYRAWGWNGLATVLQDLRYGMRSMMRSPALTLVALLSLALGIGANTAIFSFLDAVMLRSLPIKDPKQLVLLGEGLDSGQTDRYGSTDLYSYPFFRQLQQRNAVFSDVAAVLSMRNDVHGTVDGRDETELIHAQIVSGNYFATLGVQPVMGRMLNEADDSSEGDHPVVVISDTWWKRGLAGDPNVLNRKIKLGTTTFNIVGVAPAEFFGTKVGEKPDIWVPASMIQSVPPNWNYYKQNFSQSFLIVGRLKPGTTIKQATSNVDVLYHQIIRGFSDVDTSKRNMEHLDEAHVQLTSMATGISGLRQTFSEPLKILMAITALVLLIACANIANLLLARSTVRVREFAVRQALGAQRGRLVRQLLTESLLLATIGGMLGVAFAAFANRLLLRMISSGPDVIPLDVSINMRLLLFCMAITVLTALIFGCIPALRGTRIAITETLKDGRSTSNTNVRNPLGKSLIVLQVAISLVLMVGAILFIHSLANLNKVDTGFNREGVLRMEIDATVTNIKPSDPRMISMFREIEERVSTLPGVKAASFAAFFYHQGTWNNSIHVPGVPYNENIDVNHNVIGDGYFKTMQIPLLAGRSFGPQDTSTSQRVAIISESVAKNLFPAGVNPIGHHYYTPSEQPANDRVVIGIAKDVKLRNLNEEQQYIDYFPSTQSPWGFQHFAVRYDGDVTMIANAVQQTIHSINRTLPIGNITTLDKQVASSITNQRLVAQLSAFFGALAVFLSCIGIYGLMSYMVGRRTNEIGIRIAIGATRANVRWLVMREIVLLVAIGVAIGIPAAFAGNHIVGSMLFGLNGMDVASLLCAILALLGVAIVAGYLPAQRAARVDPMVALRYE
ncbi:ABC transporter permease [Edaphobacter albus]|uniref:ABC transporter permease n=1 Tax=Edaphobacter sp. 4G125 TaxID=2763071 RepID=UPI0016493C89|nr:ABC transporter permease [Edaphobacter sp. 4G125]QNI36954.1 ABC transporter permease [Edaphobacter sp. 4G125]